ncbi:hypothetical protein [Pseudoclavibacter helvolus]|uniref:hypothetical protein n=1 Tax=Pseudoclavibacter helvolus TaxID=255205 RepID=UPI003C78C16B
MTKAHNVVWTIALLGVISSMGIPAAQAVPIQVQAPQPVSDSDLEDCLVKLGEYSFTPEGSTFKSKAHEELTNLK